MIFLLLAGLFTADNLIKASEIISEEYKKQNENTKLNIELEYGYDILKQRMKKHL